MADEAALDDRVLTTVATPITAADAEALALDRFGVRGQATALTSERDQNFLLRTSGGDFVLKLANPAEDPAVADFQSGALQHLARQDPTLPVPRVLTTRDGQTLTRLEAPGEAPRTVRLLTFLPGRMLHQVPSTPALRHDLGAVHARLGLALRGFDHPASGHELLWDLKHAGKLRACLPHIQEPARQGLVKRAMEAFMRHAEPALPRMRTQVIHNDLNAHNVVVDPDDPERVCGVLDFGDMVRSPLVCDVAVAASYQVAAGEGPLGGATDFLRGYHALSPLQPDELDLLFDLMVTRMMMSVLISSWRAARYPENRAYILRNTPAAWAGLERLSGLPRSDARAILEAACRGTA